MDRNDDDYEVLLRQFQPRKPGLPIVAAPARSRFVWMVPVAVAAAVIVAALFLSKPESETPIIAPNMDSRETRPVFRQKAAELSFDVASVKPTPPQSAGPGQPSITLIPPGAGTLRRTNTTLRMLVRLAYDLQEYQVLGGPTWVDADRYDVEAKAAGPASRDEVLRMIQTLLAERFRLKAHREMKEGSVFHLVKARGGLKVKPSDDSSSADVRIGRYSGRRSMVQLAQYLGSIVGRPVTDRTELSGPFEIRLEFTPELVPIGPNGPIVDPNGPSIFTAVQEQLGLRLEAATGTIETLFIDDAQRPDPN